MRTIDRLGLQDRFVAWRRRRFYRRFVRVGDLVFDVGANVGNRTSVFLALGARVVAVEPQSACREALTRQFSSNAAFTLEPVALGAAAGSGRLRIPSATTIASLSEDFIERTRASGRFTEFSWDGAEGVEMSTLDHLIARYGAPAFCKIDVEGFEPQVLAGLSSPIMALSIEVASELVDHALACVDRLVALGAYEFAFSDGESMALGPWEDPARAGRRLESMRPGDWGDLYAQLPTARRGR